ncbi:hypothetical protein IMG5_202110 [Ichthyophthirius multifiliis]|uniref:Uncharacterized protein n=1 Tax=Ichthyophthirius multifiliis TaxID=5932 RepID=G0R628_ICHMU|nr:hypothetical protein IMG5_202110 [Ichthyophthirius multifiliis]EGR27094.1 hypothetical protein IMG5_202110 [Ichthyophthirius multifiliis]|eukprot:XP_004023978.1 hypothetical protein IMG5_202110 [Ichthyophthirius multifiliis]
MQENQCKQELIDNQKRKSGRRKAPNQFYKQEMFDMRENIKVNSVYKKIKLNDDNGNQFKIITKKQKYKQKFLNKKMKILIKDWVFQICFFNKQWKFNKKINKMLKMKKMYYKFKKTTNL